MKFHLIFRSFHSRKCKGACRLQNWRPSCFDLNVLKTISMFHFIHIEPPFAEGIVLLNHVPVPCQICKVLLHHLIGKTLHEHIFQQWEFLNWLSNYITDSILSTPVSNKAIRFQFGVFLSLILCRCLCTAVSNHLIYSSAVWRFRLNQDIYRSAVSIFCPHIACLMAN